VLPVRGKRKAITVMSVTELREALGLTAKPRDGIEIDPLFREALHDVAGLAATTSELILRKPELDKARARKLKERLTAVVDELSRAFAV
jgi:hypothetical protein